MNLHLLDSLAVTCKIVLVIAVPLLVTAILLTYLSLINNKYIDWLIDILINIPIIFPPIGIGFILVFLLSKNGYLGKILGVDIVFTFTGICIAAYITGIPFITRSIMAGKNSTINELCEAAYTLGQSRIRTFLLIVLPLLKNSVIQGLILAIGRIMGEVGITLMIGGNINGSTTTISLDIYNAVLDGENDKALMLSGILFVFSLFLFYILRYIGNKTQNTL